LIRRLNPGVDWNAIAIDTVVQAMQAGAQDFFVKPASPERIMVSIRNALQLGELKGEVDRLKKRSSGKITFDELIGAGPAMALVKRLGERAAKSSIPILILFIVLKLIIFLRLFIFNNVKVFVHFFQRMICLQLLKFLVVLENALN